MKTTLKNIKIVNFNETINDATLILENGIIKSIKANNSSKVNEKEIDAKDLIAIPGFIDMHIHGAFRKDFMDSTLDSWKTLLSDLPLEGTTSVVAASITADLKTLTKALKVMNQAIELQKVNKLAPKTTTLLGCHMEGPYISEVFKGAHKKSLLRKPNINEIRALQKAANGNVKIITYAPELANETFTKDLKALNIIPSIGHSDANFEETLQAFKDGANHTTHLYNAMSGFRHRDPGIVAASFHNKGNILNELICDGIHVKKEIIGLTYEILGPNRIVLVTDAINPKGCKDGDNYISGGIKVAKKGALLTLSGTDTIAGSGVTMIECFRNIIRYSDATISDAVKMSSYNAAKQLKIEDKVGIIKTGMIADVIVLNAYLEIVDVFVKGISVFGKLTAHDLTKEEY